MSITKPNIGGYEGWRVRRRIGGVHHQKYFPLGNRLQAEAYDELLAQKQKMAKDVKAQGSWAKANTLKAQVGSIKRINRKWETAKGKEVVRQYFTVPLGGKVHHVPILTVKKAWAEAITLLATAKGLDPASVLATFPRHSSCK